MGEIRHTAMELRTAADTVFLRRLLAVHGGDQIVPWRRPEVNITCPSQRSQHLVQILWNISAFGRPFFHRASGVYELGKTLFGEGLNPRETLTQYFTRIPLR